MRSIARCWPAGRETPDAGPCLRSAQERLRKTSGTMTQSCHRQLIRKGRAGAKPGHCQRCKTPKVTIGCTVVVGRQHVCRVILCVTGGMEPFAFCSELLSLRSAARQLRCRGMPRVHHAWLTGLRGASPHCHLPIPHHATREPRSAANDATVCCASCGALAGVSSTL